MRYFLVDQSQEIMRNSFFYYRKKMENEKDAIISIVENENSSDKDIIQAQKKLLKLEVEFRTKFNKRSSPPVKLEIMFSPKYSM